LLAGYVIEALLKGILIARHEFADNTTTLPGWLKAHDLSDLLDRLGVELDASLLVVQRAQRAVLWSGRYPAPTRTV
jgi:hypothetical protein